MARPVVSQTAEDLYQALGPMRDEDEALDWPLLRFCQAIAAPVAEVAELALDTETQVGWGPILDPTVCPAKALPWLGQFVGAVVPVGSDETTARAIVMHSPGWARGTPASIIATAQLWLTGAQHVDLEERAGGSAYAVEVTVYEAEVIDLASLTAAVQAALPAGFSLTVTTLAGWTVDEMETQTSADDVAYVESNWATVTAFEQQLP